MEHIDGKQTAIEHHHRPGITQNRIDQTDQTAAHIDNTQLQHRGHHHRDNHQRRADITENLKVDIHTNFLSNVHIFPQKGIIFNIITNFNSENKRLVFQIDTGAASYYNICGN